MYKRFTLIFICFLLFQVAFAAEESCGKLLSAVVSIDSSKNKAAIENFYFKDEAFCETSNKEINSNLVISLFDKNKKLLLTKSIYINSFTVIENHGDKDSGEILEHKAMKKAEFRNIKFALQYPDSELAFYKILSIGKNTLLGQGKVNLEKISGEIK